MTAKDTALAFVEAINRHDVDEIIALMAEEHRFVDAHNGCESKEDMRQGWPGYFAWFPDYRIEVEQVIVDGDTVGLFGYARGTYGGVLNETGDNRWRLPACWRVVAEDGLVLIWQVYCDTKIPYEIIGAYS